MTLNRTWRALGATTLAGGLLLAGAPLASADAVRDAQWPIQQLGLEKAWSVSKGDGVIVAVIDSGVDPNHPDLAGQILPGYDPGGQGRETNGSAGHGTSMAAIIAGKGHGAGEGVIGVAPGAKILPIYKAAADEASGVADGIRWAADHGAKVVNISQGRPGTSTPKMVSAVEYALSKDVLVVVAAGNSGTTPIESPGNTPGVLAIGAVDKSGKIWAKSNYGPEVLLAAPGVDIVSAGNCNGNKYCVADGTSSATAYASGAAALLRAKYPDLTAGQIANRLVKSAKAPSGTQLPDAHYGYGCIRPYEALTQDIPAGSAQGPLKASSGSAASNSPSGAASPAPSLGGGDTPGGSTADVKDSESFSFLGKGLAIGGAVLLGLLLVFILIVVLIVRASKRRRAAAAPQLTPPPGQAPYGYPAAQPPYPNQPYGQQPPPSGYPQQGNQPPYQNPYGSGGNQ
ncbi:type VII secretion-associated serine protease mycosin [Kitasatospora sp. NPDC051853]|uniref:type VII secretion-associated serine protease mycosin n=1 Tax=Kitasatospora sp. NPDC051853 TaxID=3364058 RepID=UPI0037A554EF